MDFGFLELNSGFRKQKFPGFRNQIDIHRAIATPGRGGGGRLLGLILAGYVPLGSQNPYPIIVYSVAKYRLHLSHFWENVIFRIPTW